MSAVFSECGKYRYELRRSVATPGPGRCVFVMLNPSTADATEDDPTIKRCLGFCQKWELGELIVCNLFAYRSTDPKKLKWAIDPFGPVNYEYIERACSTANLIVCAWGNHGSLLRASDRFRSMADYRGYKLTYLRMNKSGEPSHPLYLPRNLSPLEFRL